METWAEVRRRVLTGEISKREACRRYRLHWDTLTKILTHEEPPGYRRRRPRAKPTLGPFLPVSHAILESDRRAPRKQRHTARRIFDRLREEHGYAGCESIVRAAVADWKKTRAEVFVPLAHPPGEAQVDFGFAEVVVAGERVTAAFFVLTLPHSDAFFVRGLPEGVHRDVPGRARPGVRLLRRGADPDQLRQLEDRGGRNSRGELLPGGIPCVGTYHRRSCPGRTRLTQCGLH
jgi:transposase